LPHGGIFFRRLTQQNRWKRRKNKAAITLSRAVMACALATQAASMLSWAALSTSHHPAS
jgi:hypothetical protein